MTQPTIDEKAKAYLVACLVTGIDVTETPDLLMNGLVKHLNSTERLFWTEGDEDGVIVHDKNDVPILSVMYNNNRLTFSAFDMEEFDALGNNKMIGFALLNIIGYLQENAYEFGPSILGSEAYVIDKITNAETQDTNPEDWSL